MVGDRSCFLRKSFETFTSLFKDIPCWTQDQLCVRDSIGVCHYWWSLEKEDQDSCLFVFPHCSIVEGWTLVFSLSNETSEGARRRSKRRSRWTFESSASVQTLNSTIPIKSADIEEAVSSWYKSTRKPASGPNVGSNQKNKLDFSEKSKCLLHMSLMIWQINWKWKS